MRLSWSALSVTALSLEVATAYPSKSWGLHRFTSLVTFGDSYTDENRLNYFGNHNGSAPPVGWVDPPVSNNDNCGYLSQNTKSVIISLFGSSPVRGQNDERMIADVVFTNTQHNILSRSVEQQLCIRWLYMAALRRRLHRGEPLRLRRQRRGVF
jgi:hypothetical protein